MLRSIALPAVRGGLQRTSPAISAKQATLPIYKRSLVSTVLLSRDAYEGQKVSELKGELKQRGLSTTGKRQELVKRLLESDSRNAKVLPSGDTSGPRQVRSASSQASASSKDASSPPSPTEGYVGGFSKPTISHPPDIEPGQVSSAVHHPTGAIVTPEKMLDAPPTAPGVPPEKTPQVPITFDIKIPYEVIPKDKGPDIPLMTSYFHPESPMYVGPPPTPDGPLAHVPKVITVSGEDTYPGGGVSHHAADFEGPEVSLSNRSDSSANVEAQQTLSSAISSLFSSMRNDLGLSVDSAVENNAKGATARTVETTRTLLKEARDNLASRSGAGSSSSGSAPYSTASYSGGSARPLNDDERRGLYVLAGIVGAGFLLGGAGKPTQRKIEKVKAEINEKVQEAKREALPLLPDTELAALVAKAEIALKESSVSPFGVPAKGRAGKAFGDHKQ